MDPLEAVQATFDAYGFLKIVKQKINVQIPGIPRLRSF